VACVLASSPERRSAPRLADKRPARSEADSKDQTFTATKTNAFDMDQ